METAAFTVELQTNMHGPHPRLVINSSVISAFIMQTEIDIQGSDSLDFLMQMKVPFFKHLENGKISVALLDSFIVLLMNAGKALHTNKLPIFQVAFRRLSVRGLFLKKHHEIFMTFCDHAVTSQLLLNAEILFSRVHLYRSYFSDDYLSRVSWLAFKEFVKSEDQRQQRYKRQERAKN